MRTGILLTAAAGPLSNMLLALMCTVIYGLLLRFAPALLIEGGGESGVAALLEIGISVNVALTLFNLIPLPPLDGSRILDWLMPDRLRPVWERASGLAPLFLFAVMLYGGAMIEGPSRIAREALGALLRAMVS